VQIAQCVVVVMCRLLRCGGDVQIAQCGVAVMCRLLSVVWRCMQNIKRLRQDTGAGVKMFDMVKGCPERILAASSVEEAGAAPVAALEAIMRCISMLLAEVRSCTACRVL
jgi:hypothetical protein